MPQLRYRDLIYAATGEVEFAVWGCDHVADDTAAGRDGGGSSEGPRRRVKANDSVGRHTGFDIPDHPVWSRGDAVGFTAGTARRTPLLGFSRRRVESPQVSALVVGVVDHVVRRDGEPARSRTSGERVLAELHRRGVETRKLVRTELAEVRHAFGIHRDPVRQRVRRGYVFQDDQAGLRIKPPHVVSTLHGEPQHSFLIENRSMRVVRALVRQRVFAYLACSRIELAYIPFESP